MLKAAAAVLSILGFLFGPAAVLLGLATVLNPAAEASCLSTANVGTSRHGTFNAGLRRHGCPRAFGRN